MPGRDLNPWCMERAAGAFGRAPLGVMMAEGRALTMPAAGSDPFLADAASSDGGEGKRRHLTSHLSAV